MSTRHDPPAHLEPLTPEERAWAERLAQIGPHGGPPAALDARILAAAHAAAAPRPHKRLQRRRWPTLLGAAASLVIVVGLAWQLQPLLRTRPSLSEGPPAAPAPMAGSEGSLSDDVLAAADPVAKTAAGSPPPSPTPAPPNKALRPPQAVANARQVAIPAPPPATQPRDFGDDAVPPYTDYAGMAAARQAAAQAAARDATARASTDERRERALVESPQPFPATDAAAMSMPAPPSLAAPASSASSAASGAAAPTRDASARKAAAAPPAAEQAERDNATLDRIQVTGSRINAADVPVRDDTRLEPVAWLQRIRDRRDAHDLDGARASLALFRESYPRVRLPADLAQLGR